ncbi:MAG: hypothetical protein NTZ21_01600 [Actinobacteria bacterium]|nr:hypothetical protein [Actinomycetota bacterium]
MLFPDPRGYRVALVADAIVNEGAAEYDVVSALEAATFGMIVPPPSEFTLRTIASTMEYIVDDLADYAKQGYRVVVIGASSLPQSGLWSELLDTELARRGLPPFESFDVDSLDADDLARFLAAVTPAAMG